MSKSEKIFQRALGILLASGRITMRCRAGRKPTYHLVRAKYDQVSK